MKTYGPFLFLLGLLLAACTIAPASSQPDSGGQPLLCTSGGASSVPLKVETGPRGSTLAFVPVSIHGKGPFPFTLDTGAATSLISARLVTALHLRVVGRTSTPVMGITGGARADIVAVPSWKVGTRRLPPDKVVSLSTRPGHGPLGLLGSDILSRFRSIKVDYTKGTLVLCA